MASWYYLNNGQQAGPVDLDALRGMVHAGQIGSAELVWCDGMPSWMPVTSVPQLADLVGPPPAAHNQPYPAPASYAAASYPGQPAYSLQYGNAPRPNNGTTVVGIISIVWGGLFVLCVGIGFTAMISRPQSGAGSIASAGGLVAFASLVLHFSLAASGIGTLMRKSWAKVLVWVITGPLIGLYSFNTFNSLSKHQPLATQAAEGGYYCGLFGAVGLSTFWLLFLIWFYQRPTVNQEFESAAASGGPGPQDGMYR